MDITRRLRNHALPDPHDEREVLHAPLLREAADEIERLRDALTDLMKYNPRTHRIGGIDNGYDVPAGAAICAVLDKCEAALKAPNAS